MANDNPIYRGLGVTTEQVREAFRPHSKPPKLPSGEFMESGKAWRDEEANLKKSLFHAAQKLAEWDGWIY